MPLNVRLQSIIDRFPEAERIFTWYEIELTEKVLTMKVEEACDAFQIESEDLIMDLEEIIEESTNTEWLSNGGSPQWTEGFTEETDANADNNDTEDEAFEESTGFDDAEEYTEG
jgi:hypothetical protein